ncbi:MAG: Flp1 family type IVb pilin [Bacillota bacterium]|nr:Flp1 family type IVb pilin [Bacillota bacterium]
MTKNTQKSAAGITSVPLNGKRGFGTLEVVIIIAVLLSVALIFRTALTDYANNLIQTVLGDQKVIEDLAVD